MTNDDGGSYRNANFDDNFTGRSQVPFWYHVMVIMVRTFNDGDMGGVGGIDYNTSKTNVAPWCYKWIGYGMDGSPGGVRYI